VPCYSSVTNHYAQSNLLITSVVHHFVVMNTWLQYKNIRIVCCFSESVLMCDFEEMEAEIMDQIEVEALP